MIKPIAEDLQIPFHRIYANTLQFTASGDYSGFDDSEFTSKDGGKAQAVGFLMKAHAHRVVVIGDGVTDMQACPPAELFVGFGGVVVRDKVAHGADWFIRDFQELIQVLK